MHLTNSSVQKERSDNCKLPDFLRYAVPAGGSKCSLVTLQALLAEQGVVWEPIWQRIIEVRAAEGHSLCMHVADKCVAGWMDV